METTEQSNISNLSILESEFTLTKVELDDFKKLSKADQEKQKEALLAKLLALTAKLEEQIKVATITGVGIEEAKKLQYQLEQEIQDLEKMFDVSENPLLKDSFEVTPDLEITSADTAVAKLEKHGHSVSHYAKQMLKKVNWQEKLRPSYEVVSIAVGSLFGDAKLHTYADIKTKALELEFELVPASLVPSIRLQRHEKVGINIAMEAIRDGDGALKLFHCSWEGTTRLYLADRNADDTVRWGDSIFFFVRKQI